MFAAALLHKVDFVMLSMQKNEVHGVIKDYLFLAHPAPGCVKEHIGTQPTVHVSSILSS